MSDPNIQVVLTDESELHCFKLVLHPHDASGRREHPVEIFLHTSQAIDLFSKLASALSEYMEQSSRTLLRHKTGMTDEELRKLGLIPPRN